MLVTFYHAVMSILIVFGSVSWGGDISKFDRGKLEKIVKTAGHVGNPLDFLRHTVIKDCTHTDTYTPHTHTHTHTHTRTHAHTHTNNNRKRQQQQQNYCKY